MAMEYVIKEMDEAAKKLRSLLGLTGYGYKTEIQSCGHNCVVIEVTKPLIPEASELTVRIDHDYTNARVSFKNCWSSRKRTFKKLESAAKAIDEVMTGRIDAARTRAAEEEARQKRWASPDGLNDQRSVTEEQIKYTRKKIAEAADDLHRISTNIVAHSKDDQGWLRVRGDIHQLRNAIDTLTYQHAEMEKFAAVVSTFHRCLSVIDKK